MYLAIIQQQNYQGFFEHGVYFLRLYFMDFNSIIS